MLTQPEKGDAAKFKAQDGKGMRGGNFWPNDKWKNKMST